MFMGKVKAELLLTKSQKLLDLSKQIQQKSTTQRSGNILNFLPQYTAEKEHQHIQKESNW